MQFKTIGEPKSGSYRFVRSVGTDRFFAFDYEAHNPNSECIRVELRSDVMEFGANNFWPDIQAGTRTGGEAAQHRGARLCCSNVRITRIKIDDVDTTPKVVREALAEFVQLQFAEWTRLIDPLRPEWLTSDVIALARGIHADVATDRYPILSDALRDAGCEDLLIHDHLQMCPDHGPSCWVVEMILDQSTTR